MMAMLVMMVVSVAMKVVKGLSLLIDWKHTHISFRQCNMAMCLDEFISNQLVYENTLKVIYNEHIPFAFQWVGVFLRSAATI